MIGDFLNLAMGKTLRSQMLLVNLFVNRFVYIEEKIYSDNEWLMSREFIRRGGGDCEDFAITKYQILYLLGFDENQMAIMVLRNRISKVGHAVLGLRIDGDWKLSILDNNSNSMLSIDDLSEWNTIVSFNEKGWKLLISSESFPGQSIKIEIEANVRVVRHAPIYRG